MVAIKQGRINDAIGVVLILNTVANTLGSSLAGAQVSALYGATHVIYLSIALTIVLLIFSELIPKMIAVRYSGSLSGVAGHAFSLLIPVLRPALWVTNAIVYFIARRPGERITRRELAQVIGSAGEEGALTATQSHLMGNLIKSNDPAAADVMTPIAAVFSMRSDQTLNDLLTSPKADAFSRIPLYHTRHDVIEGYVFNRDALKAAAQGCDRETPLRNFRRPIPQVHETMAIERVIQHILGKYDAIATVVGSDGAAVGLLTLEDLFEAMLGMEITDEAEAVGKLRPAVSSFRKARLSKLKEREVDDAS